MGVNAKEKMHEYHIDLSDEEITNLLNDLIKKYSECVKLIDWFWRDEFYL